MYLWNASDAELMGTIGTACIVLSGINLFALLLITINEFFSSSFLKLNVLLKNFFKIV
jgi:hypothetical protein